MKTARDRDSLRVGTGSLKCTGVVTSEVVSVPAWTACRSSSTIKAIGLIEPGAPMKTQYGGGHQYAAGHHAAKHRLPLTR